MSPVDELRQAAARIITRTDAEISQLEKWLAEEEEPDLIAGHSAELERLEDERAIVAYIKRANFDRSTERAIEAVAQEELDAGRYGRQTITFPGKRFTPD